MALAPVSGSKNTPKPKEPEKKDPPKKEEKVKAAETATKQANSKRSEASTAQEKARKDEKAAQKAEGADKKAQKDKTEAKDKLDSSKSSYQSRLSEMDRRGPRPGDSQRLKDLDKDVKGSQEKYDKASKEATKTSKEATEARAKADTSKKDAIEKANTALKAEKNANAAAKAAGMKEPFSEANGVKDAFDAGSLSTKAQEKLFGTRAAVTPQEAAKADATRVSEATNRGARAGSEELNRQLSQGTDPKYRAALAKETQGDTKKMAEAVGSEKTSTEDRNAIVKNLASSADKAGPEARKTIANQLNNAPGQERVLQGLEANKKDAKTVELGAEMARQERASFNYDKADKITKLSPEFAKKAAETPKDKALRSEVDLNTVAEERGQVEKTKTQTEAGARTRTDQIFDMAQKDPKDLPPGVSIEGGQKDDDRAVMTVKDKEGNVVERTQAERVGKGVRLDSTRYDGEGGGQRSVVDAYDDEQVKITEASWKKDSGEGDLTNRSLQDIKNMDNLKVGFSETQINKAGDSLETSSFTRDAKTGVTETTKSYGKQDNKDGINDQLDDRFDGDRPIDTVKTKSTNIPPEGTKGPDGKLAKATVTEGTSYSQGNTRATASQTKSVDSPANENLIGGKYTQLSEVGLRAEDADASPKNWTLQESKPGELNTQTFVEGQKDLSVVNRKKLEGNTVTETTEGKVPNPKGEGDPVSIKGSEKRTYNDKGQIVSAQSDKTDVNGDRTVSDYQRTEARNKKGELEVTEKSSILEDPKDGPNRSIQQEQVTAQTAKGPQLLRASQTVTGPDGTAKASISPKGQELTVNGKRIDTLGELRDLPKGQAALGATAQDGLSEQVRDFNELSKGLEKQVDQKQRKFDRGEERAAAGANSYGLGRLKQALTTANSQATGTADPSADPRRRSSTPVDEWKNAPSVSLDPSARLAGGASGAFQAIDGIARLKDGASNFLGDIRDRNYAAVARDVTDVGLGGASVYSGSKALTSAIKGSGNGLTLGGAVGTGGGRINPSIAGELAGRAAVGLGVLSGGAQAYHGIKEGNGWQVASGAVTAGAAVGGYLAAGAAAGAWGGPAGAAVGLGVGLAAYGVTKVFDHFDKSEYDIARPRI